MGRARTRSGAPGRAAMRAAMRRVSDLVADPANVRAHDEKNLEAIKASLLRFGQQKPIVVDADGVVVAGNGTLAAAQALGWDQIAVVRTELKGAERTAYAIADNRTAELATWDDELSAVLASLNAEEPELLVAAGFSNEELDALVGEALGGELIEDDDVPEPPNTPVTKLGDVWTLGDHRVLCGSCEQMGAVMDESRYSLLVTDPPYGVSYAAKNEFLNAVAPANRIQTPIEGDHHTPEEMSELWRTWFSAIRPYAEPGAVYYVTGPQVGDLLLLLLLALRDSGFPLRHMLVWVKNNHVLGRSDYHYKHEPIIYGWVKGTHHRVENRSEVSTWCIDKPHRSELHPTMKPVELYARAMRNSSDRGAVVADPFLGSGTALIAAEKLNRRCFGVELSPAYCDVIVERWQNLTGGKATRG